MYLPSGYFCIHTVFIGGGSIEYCETWLGWRELNSGKQALTLDGASSLMLAQYQSTGGDEGIVLKLQIRIGSTPPIIFPWLNETCQSKDPQLLAEESEGNVGMMSSFRELLSSSAFHKDPPLASETDPLSGAHVESHHIR